MDNPRCLLGIRKMDKVPNARIRLLCGLKKVVDEMKVFSDGSARMENDRNPKRVYEGKCAGSRSVSKPMKRWIDTVKEFEEKGFGCQASKDNGA